MSEIGGQVGCGCGPSTRIAGARSVPSSLLSRRISGSSGVWRLARRASAGRVDGGVDERPEDDLSVSAGLIPFINHDDPTRASIAARLLRQSVPIQGAQRAAVETAVADRLAGEHGVVRAQSPVRQRHRWQLGRDHTPRQARPDGGRLRAATPSTTGVNGLWRPLSTSAIPYGQGTSSPWLRMS